MIVETKRKAIKTRLRAFIMAIVFSVVVVVIFFSGLFDKSILGLDRYELAITAVSLYLLISLYYYLLDLNYLYINVEKGHFIIRYYSLRPFAGNKKSIEIPLDEVYKFEIKDRLYGLKKTLILYRKMKKGVAKYPEISLTTLNDNEMKRLKKQLLQFVSKK